MYVSYSKTIKKMRESFPVHFMRLLWLDSKSKVKTDQYKKNNRPIYEHIPLPKTTPSKIPGNNIRLGLPWWRSG